MTVTLGVGAVIAGRFLAAHAGRAAGKIARSTTYRFRVANAVTRSVTFEVKSRHMRAWLKTIISQDLERPFEESGPDLALRLDGFLTTADPIWSENRDHLSHALELVEAVFMAVLQREDTKRFRELNEQWTRARNKKVVEVLAEAAGGYAGGMSASDRALWLFRRSDARRQDRLAPFMIEADQVSEALHILDSRIPEIPAGSALLLVGGFGSGKSELAEQWHRGAIRLYGSDPESPLPIWLHARTAATVGLEQAIHTQVGVALRQSGIALAVDGLDEVDTADAEVLLRDARVVVASDPRSSALLTTRPDVVSAGVDEIRLKALDDDQARVLIESVCGHQPTTWAWSPALRATIRSPFFALATGARMRDVGGSFAGEADLIVGLVQNALRRGNSQVSTQDDEIYQLLVRCSCALVDSGAKRDNLTFAERQRLRPTRLVTPTPDGNLAFTLPIFQQWFAAQALLESTAQVARALESPGAFGRWRWSIAIAALSGQSHQLDELLGAVLATNPGAGAWVVNAIAQRPQFSDPTPAEIDQREAERRLLLSARAWADALGALAPLTLFASEVGAPISIGVRSRVGRNLDVGVSVVPTSNDKCVELPLGVHPFVPLESAPAGWLPIYSGPVAPGAVWPWSFWREVVAGRTLKLLESSELLGPPGGIWDRERLWLAARMLLGQMGPLHRPIPVTDVVTIVDERFAALREDGIDAETAVFRIRGRWSLPARDLQHLETYLAASQSPVMVRPVPPPDLEQPTGGLVTDLYSDSRLLQFVAEVLGLACEGYEEAASGPFASFAWSLGAGAAGPLGVLGVVEFAKPGTPRLGGRPIMRYVRVPLPLVEQYIGSRSEVTISTNRRAAIAPNMRDDDDDYDNWAVIAERWARSSTDWAEMAGVDSPFWSYSIVGSAIDVGHERPVSQCVAQWLWGDLKRLSLDKGTSPNLRR